MRVRQDMLLVDTLTRLISETRRWSPNPLLRFGPRLTDFAIPDGHIMTVQLEGFREKPEVALRLGGISIPPLSCVRLSHEPGQRSWQAVFECPQPLSGHNEALRLVRSGSGKVVRAAVREPEPDRPTRDATWDDARWVQSKAHASEWLPQREDSRTRVTHVATGPGTIRLSTTAPAGQSPSALAVAESMSSLPRYQLTSEGEGHHRLVIAEFLAAADCEKLPPRSTWRIWATAESTSPRELGLASRDLILPRDAIVYPAETVRVGDSSFTVRAYWSALGTLRLSVQRAETPSMQGASA